jgi:antitoxin ParD1/3/4
LPPVLSHAKPPGGWGPGSGPQQTQSENTIRGKVKSGRYTNASEVVREALRRLEQEDLMQEQTAIADPDGAAEKILEGWASIQQGRRIELKNDVELKEFFADIASRGMKRLAVKGRASRAGETMGWITAARRRRI